MKQCLINLISRRIAISAEEIIEKMEKNNIDTVSFDIFDTLVCRNVPYPKMIFEILEKKYIDTFKREFSVKKERELAELRAVKYLKVEDVNIDEIYDFFEGVDEQQKLWIKNQEIYLEKIFCCKNKEIFTIYKWCRDNGKRIILISDMYLSEDFLVQILNRCGYEYWNALYISNELRARKSTGCLYDLVLKREKHLSTKIVHIGDSLKGDYLMARTRGIKSYLHRSMLKKTEYCNRKVRCSSGTYKIINTFIKNNLDRDADYFEKIGYETIGPILYGYVKWLQLQVTKKNIKKIFFLTREGEILRKAYEIVYPHTEIENTLIRVSRRATLVPLLYKCKNLDEVLNTIVISRDSYTMGELLKACQIDLERVYEKLRNSGIQSDAIVSKLSKVEKGIVWKIIGEIVYEVSINQNEMIRGYLSEVGFDGPLAVADVGWHGTIQSALQRVTDNTNIVGLYIGKKSHNSSEKSSIWSEAYLFDDKINNEIRRAIMSAPNIFEMSFLATEGTTLSYDIDESGKYIAILDEVEHSKESIKKINKIQEAALRFVRDFNEFEMQFEIDTHPVDMAAGYCKFIDPPSQKTVNLFREFTFLNVEKVSKLVAKHSLFYYVFHLKELRTEFLNNGCKAVFLKSLLFLPLPYSFIIEKLRRLEK